ncbi:MAG: hypothetical protein RIS20_2290 [Bacteroidota bacterium]|jgi:abortive infection bacteriophage resistance protein
MANKTPLCIVDQINLLKRRGMLFKDEQSALQLLENISYYRLKGYWWDMQEDLKTHNFIPNTYFEEIVDRYNFDRKLRLILFDAIERIEIALRTKMIYHLSMKYGSLWYLDSNLFEKTKLPSDQSITIHKKIIFELKKEFQRSQEIFIKDQRYRFPNQDADSWKILEIASMGTLSKLYKNLKHQLPEKSTISKEMGLNINSELSSWLEAITYVRNIIAHHSRLWGRNMVKIPIEKLNNPKSDWLNGSLTQVQCKKPFLIITTMVYLGNQISPEDEIKLKMLRLFETSPKLPIYKLGFLDNWQKHPVWK